ncbi:MAG: DUF4136 domain-containing protein, partial [Cytophagaceae bacterium]
MKTSQPILLFTFFASLATGCAQHSGAGVVVGSDQRGGNNANAGAGIYASTTTDGPDFTKYKTYSWASQVTNLQNGVYFLNDLVFKGMVRDAVAHELAAKGYTYQPASGDLVVNFRSFDQPTEIMSNDNLGAGYWASEEPYAYDSQRKVKLDKGSILVQMIDRKQGVEVWQGYASGLTNGDAFDKSHDKVYVAVGQIFKE